MSLKWLNYKFENIINKNVFKNLIIYSFNIDLKLKISNFKLIPTKTILACKTFDENKRYEEKIEGYPRSLTIASQQENLSRL